LFDNVEEASHLGLSNNNNIVTAASGQDRYTNSQKASYIAHSAIVHYPAIYMRYKYKVKYNNHLI
jgi:hypothetical protein